LKRIPCELQSFIMTEMTLILQSSHKMVYVATRLMEFADSAEYRTGKTEFVVPDEFVDDLECGRIHYIAFTEDGKESKYTGKYHLTKIA
jgi:hypothetical protein